MRLLNTSTLKLSEFFDDKVPKYAILSHTWDDDEVSFHEVETPAARTKKGFAKIQGCCSTALRSGYVWVWIDTCCIDKSSSAELSEAINSMFRWYREADMCYAYLSDVEADRCPRGGRPAHFDESAFKKSRWFTRGWTLQELLAPYFIEFHDMHWIYIGGKHNHNEAISEITQIPAHLIKHGWLISHSSAAECISWVSRRTTSRREDMAYCLLGLLDVSMPILYGEGHKAFLRLQEEIIKTRYDQTLLAWGLGRSWGELTNLPGGALAISPTAFCGWHSGDRHSGGRQSTKSQGNHYLTTNLGIYIELPVAKITGTTYGLALLDFNSSSQDPDRVWLPLEIRDRPGLIALAQRALGIMPFRACQDAEALREKASKMPLYLEVSPEDHHFREQPYSVQLSSEAFGKGYYLADSFPPCRGIITMRGFYTFWSLPAALLRLCCKDSTTVLILYQSFISQNDGKLNFTLHTRTTRTDLNSLQLMLDATRMRLNVDRLLSAGSWTKCDTSQKTHTMPNGLKFRWELSEDIEG